VRTLALPLIGHVRQAMLEGDPAGLIVDRDQMVAAMRDLKPSTRAALVLRHYYGYDYAEIGRFLGTSPGNVGSILNRAHADLRSRLAEDASEPPTDLPASRRALR
jgi:DNA-directed RNA polymerase specialized sigma24 family protein